MSDETYNRVGSRVWLERWDDDTMLFALYLLTCKHRTTEGIYHLPLQYAAADRRWPMKRIERSLQALATDGFVEYDRDSEVVLIVNALKWQSPGTKNHMIGALRKLRCLPATPLLERFEWLVRLHAPAFAEYIDKEAPEVFAHAV